MTYAMVENAVKGMLEVLINQHHYNQVTFEIIHLQVGRVGGGRMSGPTPSN